MPYNENDLNPTNLNASSWALAWTRFFLRDTSTPFEFSDTELTAVLEGTRFVPARNDDDQTYYRPHVAAAQIVESDPDRAMREQLLNTVIWHRSPTSVARSIRRAGRWVDDAIVTATSEKPSSSRQLEPVF